VARGAWREKTEPLSFFPRFPTFAFLLAGWLLLALGETAWSQGTTPAEAAGKRYTKSPQFYLPFKLTEAERATVQAVQLYVKFGNGGWAARETAPPGQGQFKFVASQDGEYWFNIVTLDKEGRANPPDVSRVAPALVVVVDTQPPEVNLTVQPTGTAGMRCLRCDVRDANPDPASVRVEYQRGDKTWQPLPALPDLPGCFAYPDERDGTGLVRASVSDRAGNVGTKEITLAAKSPITQTAWSSSTPTGHVENVSAKAPAPAVVATTAKLVNSTHVVLDYRIDQIGPSGVGKVEVWITTDGGKAWRHLCDDPDCKSPAEFDLPGEGTYGISIAVKNGVGGGDPAPASGEAPDVWVEVDVTRPKARIVTVKPGVGEQAGSLIISYEASDKNLGLEPVTLSYATFHGGPWTPIARGAKNEGTFRWPLPPGLGGELYFRLEVTDLAGNAAHDETAQALVLDSSRPKAKVLGISAGGSRLVPPLGN
jgi:hypothetical protein